MIIKAINNHVMTMFLMSDPALADMALCDELLDKFKAGFGYESPYPNIYGFYKDNEFVGAFIARMLTDCCVEWHPFVATKYHHTGMINEMQQLFITYLKEHTKCTSMFTTAPSGCVHSHKVALKYGWKLVGDLPNAITWRGKVQDLNLYSQEI